MIGAERKRLQKGALKIKQQFRIWKNRTTDCTDCTDFQ
jgi:hypothetical protein